MLDSTGRRRDESGIKNGAPGTVTAYVGQSLRRHEDHRLLRGEARFAGDVHRAGMLHAALLRSPYAHARIIGIDTSAARADPAVVEVLSFRDLPAVGQPIPMRMSIMESMQPFLQRPLAAEKVRYVGDPVAVVLAESRYVAEDALELIKVDYEQLPPVIDARAASEPDAVSLDEAQGTNVVASYAIAYGDVEQALHEADMVVRTTFSLQRHTAVPIETRGLVAEWDSARSVLTMWGTAKVPYFNRSIIARYFGLAEHSVHFVQTDVGGAFGVRGELYPEDFLVPALAMRSRRPVQWIEDRKEHLLATNHSRQQEHEVAMGLRRDGTILGIHNRFWYDVGAYVRTHGATVPNNTASYLPGPYRIPHYRSEVTCALTNKTPVGTYRGPGRYEANFVRERLMDEAARALDLDAAEIRRRNFIPPEAMPYEVGTVTLGRRVIYDGGDFASLFERALDRLGYRAFRAEQTRAREEGRLLGIGIAFQVEKSGLGPWECSRVLVDPSGKIVVDSGVPSVGQGVETVFAQICADVLGVSFEDVTVRWGDTDLLPYGGGAFASRGSVMGGNAVHKAAVRVREKVLALAARQMEVDPDDLELQAGRVHVTGAPERALSLSELAQAASPTSALKAGFEPGLEALELYEQEKMTYGYGVHLVVIEVDPQTAEVAILRYVVDYDVGRMINPTLVEGQIVGGLAQGLGGALLEELAYDQEGQLLAGTLADYLLPTATEVPPIEVHVSETYPSKLNPLGIKGVGEDGTVGAGAAIANAVSDALTPLGVSVTRPPLSPARVRELIRAGQGAIWAASPRR
jgi:carbon-monoxide dehydrogenase large subunit